MRKNLVAAMSDALTNCIIQGDENHNVFSNQTAACG